MLQIRAGTGGEEAALWAADLIRMYQKYADAQVRARAEGAWDEEERHGLWHGRAGQGMAGQGRPHDLAWHGADMHM